MEQNRKAGQNPPRVVAPTEEEEEYPRSKKCQWLNKFLLHPEDVGSKLFVLANKK